MEVSLKTSDDFFRRKRVPRFAVYWSISTWGFLSAPFLALRAKIKNTVIDLRILRYQSTRALCASVLLDEINLLNVVLASSFPL